MRGGKGCSKTNSVAHGGAVTAVGVDSIDRFFRDITGIMCAVTNAQAVPKTCPNCTPNSIRWID